MKILLRLVLLVHHELDSHKLEHTILISVAVAS